MGISTFRKSGVLRPLFAVTTLVAAAVVHGQNVNVTAANASNDAIYSVAFNNNGGGSITVLNTDQGSLHHLVSISFYSNPFTLQLDLLAADNQGGDIVSYPGDFSPGKSTTGTPVFTYPSGPQQGPAYPDAMSVDPAGNLFVANSPPGGASNAQLFVLPPNGSGAFGSPVLIDGTYGANQTIAETLVVATTIPSVVNPGDVLVLTNNPLKLLKYPGNSITGSGPTSPTNPIQLPIIFPAGTTGTGGMAFWPADNTLLITTTGGTIYQYDLTSLASPKATFAGPLGNGLFKVKTGVASGLPYAYVANNNGGDILRFSGPNTVPATVTSGVQHPQGLAVTNIAYAPLSSCQNQANGCTLLGGSVPAHTNILTHNIPPTVPNVHDNIIENVCVVPVDPRYANGICTNQTLAVSQVCPGFDGGAGIQIPDFLCGAAGSTHQGFALVKTLIKPQQFNGSLIFNDSNLSVLLPSPSNPICNPTNPPTPVLGTLAWAPLAGEGIVVEGNQLLELTSGCDGGTGRQSGLSLFGVGLAINTSAPGVGSLVGFAAGKYDTLIATLADELTNGNLQQGTLANQLFANQLQQCINTSRTVFLKAGTPPNAVYDGAARELLAADQQVAGGLANFTADSVYPNPSGALRMRLGNMYYTIDTRLDLHSASSSPPDPPPPSLAPPPPQISGTPTTMIKGGSPYLFAPTAYDFAGPPADPNLTFSIVNKPIWANFDPATGRLTGTAQKGTYPGIVITVSDGCASKSLPAFSIKVTG